MKRCADNPCGWPCGGYWTLTDPSRPRRLFFALWPDEDTRRRLVRLGVFATHNKGKPVAAQNLHITLAFVGAVDSTMGECVRAQAAHTRFTAFSLRISRLGYFSRSRVLWAGPIACPPALASLVEDLNACLQPCGYQPERRPFRPHLTLVRKAVPAKPLPEPEPVHWLVENFCLVESKTHPQGVHYEVLRTYPSTVTDGSALD